MCVCVCVYVCVTGISCPFSCQVVRVQHDKHFLGTMQKHIKMRVTRIRNRITKMQQAYVHFFLLSRHRRENEQRKCRFFFVFTFPVNKQPSLIRHNSISTTTLPHTFFISWIFVAHCSDDLNSFLQYHYQIVLTARNSFCNKMRDFGWLF